VSAKNRLDTLRVIIGANPALNSSPRLTDIYGEFNLILSAERHNKNYGWLLKVLHTTRALDTSLSELLAYKGWNSQSKAYNLGRYLAILTNNGILNAKQRQDFRKTIVDKRNKYMHQAASMPTKQEADRILSEMHSCLSFVLAKI
jgi:hypothetical protein